MKKIVGIFITDLEFTIIERHKIYKYNIKQIVFNLQAKCINGCETIQYKYMWQIYAKFEFVFAR